MGYDFKKDVLISIGIPFKNSCFYLEKALASILCQKTNLKYEILCVDDNSEDFSKSIVEAFIFKYPHIKLFKNKKSGVASARNKILQEANGEYICWLDSDDTTTQNFFSVFSELISNGIHDDEIYFCSYNKNQKLIKLNEKTNIMKSILNGDFPTYLWSSIAKIKFYQKNRPFNETLQRQEDTDFILRSMIKNDAKVLIKKTLPIVNYNFSLSRDPDDVLKAFNFMTENYKKLYKKYDLDNWFAQRLWEISNFFEQNKRYEEAEKLRRKSSIYSAEFEKKYQKFYLKKD